MGEKRSKGRLLTRDPTTHGKDGWGVRETFAKSCAVGKTLIFL